MAAQVALRRQQAQEDLEKSKKEGGMNVIQLISLLTKIIFRIDN